ncbi:hypothetical protein B0T22DRAFT_176304 [Podospora appendiculata]|uniref:Uncharacterized protein n=1 Tax=Podospora appendiculata TaxID=314037 RepID=A0AAE1CDE9_9PEZI|nr:hypothetical protein B0T22DRAFT_176304 [Podospora appendiculata]
MNAHRSDLPQLTEEQLRNPYTAVLINNVSLQLWQVAHMYGISHDVHGHQHASGATEEDLRRLHPLWQCCKENKLSFSGTTIKPISTCSPVGSVPGLPDILRLGDTSPFSVTQMRMTAPEKGHPTLKPGKHPALVDGNETSQNVSGIVMPSALTDQHCTGPSTPPQSHSGPEIGRGQPLTHAQERKQQCVHESPSIGRPLACLSCSRGERSDMFRIGDNQEQSVVIQSAPELHFRTAPPAPQPVLSRYVARMPKPGTEPLNIEMRAGRPVDREAPSALSRGADPDTPTRPKPPSPAQRPPVPQTLQPAGYGRALPSFLGLQGEPPHQFSPPGEPVPLAPETEKRRSRSGSTRRYTPSLATIDDIPPNFDEETQPNRHFAQPTSSIRALITSPLPIAVPTQPAADTATALLGGVEGLEPPDRAEDEGVNMASLLGAKVEPNEEQPLGLSFAFFDPRRRSQVGTDVLAQAEGSSDALPATGSQWALTSREVSADHHDSMSPRPNAHAINLDLGPAFGAAHMDWETPFQSAQNTESSELHYEGFSVAGAKTPQSPVVGAYMASLEHSPVSQVFAFDKNTPVLWIGGNGNNGNRGSEMSVEDTSVGTVRTSSSSGWSKQSPSLIPVPVGGESPRASTERRSRTLSHLKGTLHAHVDSSVSLPRQRLPYSYSAARPSTPVTNSTTPSLPSSQPRRPQTRPPPLQLSTWHSESLHSPPLSDPLPSSRGEQRIPKCSLAPTMDAPPASPSTAAPSPLSLARPRRPATPPAQTTAPGLKSHWSPDSSPERKGIRKALRVFSIPKLQTKKSRGVFHDADKGSSQMVLEGADRTMGLTADNTSAGGYGED